MKRHISVFAFLLCAFAAHDAVAGFRLYQQYGEELTQAWADSLGFASKSFTAEPRTGWKISAWWEWNKLNPSKTKAKITGTDGLDSYTWITANHRDTDCLCEVFEPIKYTLSFAGGGGSGSMQTMSDVCYTNVFNLPPCDFTRTGWAFSCWSNSVNGALLEDRATVSGEILCISNENQQTTLTALWKENAYSISASGLYCTVSANPSSSSMYSGDVAISWTPNSQPGRTYALSAVTVYGGWDSSGTELAKFTSGTSGTFNMSKAGKGYYGAVFIRAVYAESVNAYSVALSSGGNGQVEKDPDRSSYPYGNQVTIRALADDGYAFEKWSDGSTVAERLLTVTDNVNLKATFTNRVYTLTFDPNGGTLVGEGNRQVRYGDYIGTLPTASQPKKQLHGWHRDPAVNSSVFADDCYTWTENRTLYAHWIDEEFFSVTATAVPSGSGNVSGVGTQFEKGDRTTLEAKPKEGYSFYRWNDGVTSPTRELEVLGNMAFTAFFTGNVYKVKFDLEGHKGTVSPTMKDVTFAQPYGTLPTPVFDDPDIGFDYWTDGEGAVISESSTFDTVPMDKYKYLYAHTTPRPRYFVSFAGGPDATGEMDVQKIYRDRETALTSNAFVRTGYTFLGWAETNDLAKVKYDDGEKVRNVAAADETNELHAVWQPIAYTVAFDGNGATEIAMDPRPFTYGKPQNLPPNTYVRGELWSFVGWSNEVDGTVFADGALVSNLCVVADATNTLRAIWRSNLTDLSRAMHCDNLIWIDQGTDWTPTTTGATAVARYQFLSGYNLTSYLAATGTTSGTLSFHWQANASGVVLELRDTDQRNVIGSWTSSGSAEGQQNSISVELPEGRDFHIMNFRIYFYSDEDAHAIVNIDRMTWTPKALHPEPDPEEDFVTISSAAVSNGKFILSFMSDERFAYNLLTNANLLIDSWGVMTNEVGTGKAITFEPQIIEGQPQMFYRVDTIQKE